MLLSHQTLVEVIITVHSTTESKFSLRVELWVYHIIAVAPRSSLSSMAEVECPICLSEYSVEGEHIPLTLECGHSYGKSCMRDLMASQGDHACCPQCRHRILRRFRDLNPNYSLIACLQLLMKADRPATCAGTSENLGESKSRIS